MTDQIRSADLLVTMALASPQHLQDLANNPADALKKLAVQAIEQLPRLAPPTPVANDKIWLLIVGAFALVMVGAALVLGIGVFSPFPTGVSTNQITKSDTMLTVFTTVVGFLAGLLAPSPLAKK